MMSKGTGTESASTPEVPYVLTRFHGVTMENITVIHGGSTPRSRRKNE